MRLSIKGTFGGRGGERETGSGTPRLMGRTGAAASPRLARQAAPPRAAPRRFLQPLVAPRPRRSASTPGD